MHVSFHGGGRKGGGVLVVLGFSPPVSKGQNSGLNFSFSMQVINTVPLHDQH